MRTSSGRAREFRVCARHVHVSDRGASEEEQMRRSVVRHESSLTAGEPVWFELRRED